MWRLLAVIVVLSVLVGSAVAWLPLPGGNANLPSVDVVAVRAPAAGQAAGVSQSDSPLVSRAPASWDEMTADMTETAIPAINPTSLTATPAPSESPAAPSSNRRVTVDGVAPADAMAK